jgi:NDP-sugar pyrophosphorylase family protein
MKIVILAGGKGKRLYPYTVVLPKPLMPLGDFPIIEILIRQLKNHNLTDITLAIGHLGNLIQAFLGNGEQYGVNINYSTEDSPLGTVGPLAFIKNLDSTFLVLNGDLLTTFNFSKFIQFHQENKSIATIAVQDRKVNIDYGVVEFENKYLHNYIEKPTLLYSVSMGIYLFEPEVLSFLPAGQKLDFPELMKILLKEGKKVGIYYTDEYWLDIGRPEDYQKAVEEFEQIKDKLF